MCVTKTSLLNPLSLQHPPQNFRKHPSNCNIFKDMQTLWEDLDERFSRLSRFVFTEFEEVEGATM